MKDKVSLPLNLDVEFSHVVHSIGDNDRSSFPNFIEQLLHSEQDYPIMIKEQRRLADISSCIIAVILDINFGHCKDF